MMNWTDSERGGQGKLQDFTTAPTWKKGGKSRKLKFPGRGVKSVIETPE